MNLDAVSTDYFKVSLLFRELRVLPKSPAATSRRSFEHMDISM
jgi:hypothetical protein